MGNRSTFVRSDAIPSPNPAPPSPLAGMPQAPYVGAPANQTPSLGDIILMLMGSQMGPRAPQQRPPIPQPPIYRYSPNPPPIPKRTNR